jgi:hypothetical protein
MDLGSSPFLLFFLPSLKIAFSSEFQKIGISKSDLLSGDFFYMNGNSRNFDFVSLTLNTCQAKLKILRIFKKKYSTFKKTGNILSYGEPGKKGSTKGIH